MTGAGTRHGPGKADVMLHVAGKLRGFGKLKGDGMPGTEHGVWPGTSIDRKRITRS